MNPEERAHQSFMEDQKRVVITIPGVHNPGTRNHLAALIENPNNKIIIEIYD